MISTLAFSLFATGVNFFRLTRRSLSPRIKRQSFLKLKSAIEKLEENFAEAFKSRFEEKSDFLVFESDQAFLRTDFSFPFPT